MCSHGTSSRVSSWMWAKLRSMSMSSWIWCSAWRTPSPPRSTSSAASPTSHVLPRHQLARELLDVGEAALDVDLGGDGVRQALHQIQLVGAHAQADHAPAAGGHSEQRAGDDQ